MLRELSERKRKLGRLSASSLVSEQRRQCRQIGRIVLQHRFVERRRLIGQVELVFDEIDELGIERSLRRWPVWIVLVGLANQLDLPTQQLRQLVFFAQCEVERLQPFRWSAAAFVHCAHDSSEAGSGFARRADFSARPNFYCAY